MRTVLWNFVARVFSVEIEKIRKEAYTRGWLVAKFTATIGRIVVEREKW